VVGDVGLADTVEDVLADGAHELSVDGGEGTSREGPLVGGVVREDGVGVLQVGDEDEPAAGSAWCNRERPGVTHWLTQR